MLERFRDRPEYLARLQQALNDVVEGPLTAIPKTERAMWALEDTLGIFVDDARAQLETAELSGDREAIEHAKTALLRMLHVSHINTYRFGELCEYIKRHA